MRCSSGCVRLPCKVPRQVWLAFTRRTDTVRAPSTALTCGKRATSCSTRAGVASTKPRVTSPRSTRLNCVPISTSIESPQNAPVITIAMATAMPTTVRLVRKGRRSMVRKTMRTAGENQWRKPSLSTSMGL